MSMVEQETSSCGKHC